MPFDCRYCNKMFNLSNCILSIIKKCYLHQVNFLTIQAVSVSNGERNLNQTSLSLPFLPDFLVTMTSLHQNRHQYTSHRINEYKLHTFVFLILQFRTSYESAYPVIFGCYILLSGTLQKEQQTLKDQPCRAMLVYHCINRCT